MAWIDVIDTNDASGELQEIYDHIADTRGKLSSVLKVHSKNPAALKDHLDLYGTLLFGESPLSRAQREALAVVVSAANGCDYCVHHHAEALKAYWDDTRVDQLADNYEALNDLDPSMRAACDLAVKLTRSPEDMTEADITSLHEGSWSERAVLDIVLVTSYFNFVNRIANGLGVESTEEEARGYHY